MAAAPRTSLQELAATQHGHFTVTQAREVDVGRRTIALMVKDKRIIRIHRGVYRMASTPVTWKGRLMAAVLAAGPGAVASHAWAAELHGIDRIWTPTEPEVSIPWKRSVVVPGVTAHRSRDLESCDRTTIDGISTTTVARTGVDLAERLGELRTMAVIDDLICSKKVTRRWQHARATQLVAGRPGVDVIVRITRPDAEGEFWSWLERRFHTSVVQAFDLPIPDYNVPLHDDKGLIGYADACWQRARSVVVELDGLRFHQLSRARARDSQKGNRYALSGHIPLRFTYRAVVEQAEEVARTIRAALDQAGLG